MALTLFAPRIHLGLYGLLFITVVNFNECFYYLPHRLKNKIEQKKTRPFFCIISAIVNSEHKHHLQRKSIPFTQGIPCCNN